MAKAKLPIWERAGNWKQEVLQILLQTPPKTSQRFEFCCRLSLCDVHHRLLFMGLDAQPAAQPWLLHGVTFGLAGSSACRLFTRTPYLRRISYNVFNLPRGQSTRLRDLVSTTLLEIQIHNLRCWKRTLA